MSRQPVRQRPPAGPAGAVPDSGEGMESDMLGGVRGAGLGPPRLGALGNCTGSRRDRSLLWRRPVEHPDTSKTIAKSAARRAVVFISLLLRECMVGEKPFRRIA